MGRFDLKRGGNFQSAGCRPDRLERVAFGYQGDTPREFAVKVTGWRDPQTKGISSWWTKPPVLVPGGTQFAFLRLMPRYYFKLVDGHLVTNYGVHDLDNATAAQIAAIELARSIHQERPELVGQRYSVSVTDEFGVDVCFIPIEIP